MKHLVTSALPYANGPLHFGHLAGAYLPADIYTRHRKLQGHKTLHISGSDEHGVAIMLNAQKEQASYKEYVDRWHKEHGDLFKDYQVEFDYFGQTSSDYHKEEVLKWWESLYSNGMIEPKEEDQLQCQDCHNFLPDRFVQGECYECHFESARGDECPKCGTWIEPTKLINPVCQICKSKNIEVKPVTQYYLMLSKFEKEFKAWFATKKDWRKTVVPYVESLVKEGLIDRAITRDLDWGIDIPIKGLEGKKLYVWFDAPIGYVSNTKKYLAEISSGDDYLKDWWNNSDTEITHFIGKDNIIFHTLIFPIMGMASGRINPPTNVPANQYLNLEGKQFSKSSGWYVDAKEAIDTFGPDALRYYLVSIMPESTDSSFSWEQFSAKVNNELANNIGNFVNRCFKFFHKNWPAGIKASKFESFFDLEEAKTFENDLNEVRTLLDNVQIKKGLEKVMAIGQIANGYFSDNAPWAQMKVDPSTAETTIAHSTVFVFGLATVLSPYLPNLSSEILDYFSEIYTEDDLKKVYSGDFNHLKSLFKNGLQLKKEPGPLVPKIDAKVILKFQEQLNTLLENKDA